MGPLPGTTDPAATRWEALVAGAPFHVAVADADGQLRFANRADPGSPPGASAGRRLSDLFPAARAAAAGHPEMVEVRVARGQQTRWLDLHLLPIRTGPEAGGVLAIAIEATEARQAAMELRMSVNALHRVIESREQLAADLHDGILQSLYGIGLSVEAAHAALGRTASEAGAHLEQVRDQVRTTMAEIRRHVREGIGALPGPAVWEDALAGLLRSLEVAGGPAIALEIDPRAPTRLSPAAQSEVLFIAREAVSNAVRHAGAARVVVRLIDDGPWVRLEIEDDGRGLPASPAGGFGVLTMTRRAARIGAQFSLQSVPGRGTLVRADLALGGATDA
jgi:signal transduction histidine kinase